MASCSTYNPKSYMTKKLTKIWLNRNNVVGVAEDSNDHHAIVHLVGGATVELEAKAQDVADDLLSTEVYN